MNAAHILAKEHNPLAAAFLPYARSFSLMDQMIDIPTRGLVLENSEPGRLHAPLRHHDVNISSAAAAQVLLPDTRM